MNLPHLSKNAEEIGKGIVLARGLLFATVPTFRISVIQWRVPSTIMSDPAHSLPCRWRKGLPIRGRRFAACGRNLDAILHDRCCQFSREAAGGSLFPVLKFPIYRKDENPFPELHIDIGEEA